jgi:hypothetical protein
LRTLGFALTNKPERLAKMCETFGVEHKKERANEHGQITPEYIMYNLKDVLATFELYKKLRADFDLHPIDLEPYKTYSPASISKKYLLGMNLVPPRKKFQSVSFAKLAKMTSAFFGGRAGCRFRGIVPVTYCDFLSMYPTVNALMGLWELLTAAQIKIVDVTEEVKAFLSAVNKNDCFKPELWKELNFFACVRPMHDILPFRSCFDDVGDDLNIGVNYLTSRKSLYYAGPDLVASTLLTGRPPKLERAIRLVPVGKQEGPRPIQIRGAVIIDPSRQDFFRAVVEERQ